MVWSPYEMLGLPAGSNISLGAPEGQQPRAAFRTVKDGREIPVDELPAQRAALTGHLVRDFEHDLVFEDGRRLTLLGNAVPLLDDDGRPRGSVGAFIDITERKRNEERLRQAQKLKPLPARGTRSASFSPRRRSTPRMPPPGPASRARARSW